MKISLEKPGTPEELVHIGVKGMKWGIRKERTSSSELKKRATKAFVEKSTPVVEVRLKQMFNISPLTMNDYNKMSTRSTTIPSGVTLYRMTENPKDMSMLGHTYVTTNKKDAEIYRGLLPAQRLFNPIRKSDYKQHYEINLKTTKTLHGPSEKERVDILSNLIDDKTAIGGKMSIREYYKKSQVISRKDAKNDTSLELSLKLYRRVNQNMWNRKDPVSKVYLSTIEKKGYDMLSDDNDSGIVSKNPKIILNPKKSTRLETITTLSNDDILNAQINMKFPKVKV